METDRHKERHTFRACKQLSEKWRAGGWGQRAEDRGQRAMAEDRGQRTEVMNGKETNGQMSFYSKTLQSLAFPLKKTDIFLFERENQKRNYASGKH